MPLAWRRRANTETLEAVEKDYADSRTLTGAALALSTTEVTVGNTTDDIDFKVYIGESGNTYIQTDNANGKFLAYKTTTSTSPGRFFYIQALGSLMAAGQNLQGLQIRSRATGTGTIAGGTDGAEIKAGLNSNSDTGTIAGARAIIANVDAKKGTITTGTCLEAQVDIGAGGTITTLYGVRASLNNSGTVTNGYAFHVDAVAGYGWTYGLYIKSQMATTGIYIGTSTTGITFAGTLTTGISFGSATVTTDITKAGNMTISATGTTKSITLSATGDIALNPAGADITIGGVAGSAGKLTAHATKLTIYGGDTTGDDLVLQSNSTDSDAITLNGAGTITIAATTDIALNPTGADITIGGVSGGAGKLTVSGTDLKIYGGDTTGDDLSIYANSADTEAITLNGAGAIAVVNPNTLTLTGPVIEGASGDTTCVALSDSSLNGMAVYSGTPTSGGADFTAGEPISGIRSRMLIGTAQTNDTSWYAMLGQLRIKANRGQGIGAAVRGYIEESGNTTMAAGQTSALLASVEVSSGFELSAGNIDGLRVESLANGSATMTGTYSGIYVTKGTSALDFDYGLYIADCATYPIYITNTPTGATALDMVNIVVSDTHSHSSGYARGVYVNWTHASGNITSTGEINGIGADISVTTGNVAYVFPVSIYTGGMGTGTIGSCNGLYIYQDDIGGSATVNQKYCVDLNQDNGDNATVCGFIRMYNHGGASNTIDYVMDFANSGHGAADYFFHVGATGGFLSVDTGTPGANSTHKIAIKIGASTVGYIPVYADY